MRIRVSLIAFALLIASPSLAADWEKALKRGLASELSHERRAAIRGIDTASKKGLRALWKVLETRDPLRLDWYVRQGAHEALAKATGAEAEKEIAALIKGRGKSLCKEALAHAIVARIRAAALEKLADEEDPYETLRLARGVAYFEIVLPILEAVDPEKKLLDRLKALMSDKDSRVRRAAIAGLMAYPHKDSIDLLLGNMAKLERKKKKAYEEWLRTRQALETLLNEDFGEDVAAWQDFWKSRKDSYSIAGLIAEHKKKEAEPDGMATVVREDKVEFTLTVARHGKGYPLVVLGQRHYDNLYFRPYFHGIEQMCRVYYIQMPKVADYKGLKKDPSTGLVTYPTEILARGVASALTKSGLKQFAVLAHGAGASTLAMKLSASHPNLVSHLILINPRSSGEAYTAAVENVIRHGQARRFSESVKGARNLLLDDNGKPIYEAADDAEYEGNSRAINNVQHRDATRPEVGALEELHSSPDDVEALVDESWSVAKIYAKGPYRRPVLIFCGTLDPWVPESEVQTVASAFKRARLVKLKGAGSFPFISETYAFTEQTRAFLAKAAKRFKR